MTAALHADAGSPTRAATDPAASPADIPGVVARLRSTFDSGHTRPLAWRREQLKRLRGLMRAHGDELVAALRADFGKPELEARVMDIGQVPIECSLALRNLRKWTRPERAAGLPILGRSRVVREPLGVVLIVAPWNYPVGLLLSPLVGAIAAGNCAVLKPSEVTAHTAEVLARRVPEHLDPSAVAVITGGADETQALLAQRFDHIFYTGGGRVGRIVMKAAAETLTPVTLELGGKSPCIVDADVDTRVAARRIAWGKFLNAGQTCVAPDYVLVHERREEELVREIGAAIREFYGEDPLASPDLAQVADARHFERIAKLLTSGEIAVGGRPDPARRRIEPTLLRRVSPDAPIMREEIFGPVLPVIAVRSIDEALDFVNERDKPLALYVFSRDEEVQREVVERTSSGGVCVNGTILHLSNPALPFGGVGPSGMGAYHGRHSFETFSHRKSVLTRGLRFDPSLMYPPYASWKTRLLRRFL
jgi:aldehyde dehydrogenase (NAD+)